MHSRFQYNVHQLLRLQQTRRGCCGYGASSRKVVPNEGNFLFLFIKETVELYNMDRRLAF